MMDDIAFIETTVAKRVFGIIDLAREDQENAVIVGEPGVGKTRALSAYASAPDSLAAMITINRENCNKHKILLEEVSLALGLRSGGTSYDIKNRLTRYDLSGYVLLLDEAQGLAPQSIRALLDLPMPVIFCGNHDVLKSTSAEKGPLAQISDRVGMFEVIDCIPSEDADAIANSFGVEGMDAYQLARAIGMRFRARALVRVLKGARKLAGAKTIKASDIRSAIDLYPQYRSALRNDESRPAPAKR